MKQKSTIGLFIAILLFSVFFISTTKIAFTAPGQESFVINATSKQCGTYWPGDEFSQNKLPSGWKIYEPEMGVVLDTPFGTCKGEYTNPEQYYKDCAKKLGFKYVDYKNIPYTTGSVSKFNEDGWKCLSKLGKDYYQGFLVNETSNEFSMLIDFSLKKADSTAYPTEGQCQITDKNWVTYEYPEKYSAEIVTPFGQCSNFSDYKNCCDQLGLAYVGRDLVATDNVVMEFINVNGGLLIIGSLVFVGVVGVSGVILFKKYGKINKLK
jgi:hypothetical protein